MQNYCQMYIGTYNVPTLSTEDKLIALEEEICKIKWDVLGLSDVRRIGRKVKNGWPE